MSEKVTLKLAKVNETVAGIQKVDTCLSMLYAVPRNPSSGAITTILFNNGIGRADWRDLFDVRAFHAVRINSVSELVRTGSIVFAWTRLIFLRPSAIELVYHQVLLSMQPLGFYVAAWK
mmetsp:Transcript_37164/g.148280  ORF Transcript_37164/g.148280 Transcript_37164/m.148280 type:complete len:119 (+) Transcript_37164:1644-2000(+)